MQFAMEEKPVPDTEEEQSGARLCNLGNFISLQTAGKFAAFLFLIWPLEKSGANQKLRL